MTRNEIIRLSTEAGFNGADHHAIATMLLRFAELVAAAERESILSAASDACRPFGKTGAVVMAAIRAKVGNP